MKKTNLWVISILALAILGTNWASAQQSTTTGEFRKDNSVPKIYSQEWMVNNFAQKIPLGATFSPVLTAWDAEDGDITARISQLSGVNTGIAGEYLAKYQVWDDALPEVDGFPVYFGTTTTYTLPVTVYDPAVAVPEQVVSFDALWQEGPVVQNTLYVDVGGQLSRPLKIKAADLPLLGTQLTMTAFQVQEGYWGGNNRQFAIRVVETQSGAVIYDGDASFSSNTFTPSFPIPVQAEREYTFTLRYLSGGDKQGFRVNEAGLLWLNVRGEQVQALNPHAQVLPDPKNALAYDPGLQRHLKEKLLSTSGNAEILHILKQGNPAPVLSYSITDTALATLSVQTGTTQDTLALSGLAPGETNLQISIDGNVVDVVRLVVTIPKEVTLSYSYIAFPDEPKTHLWDDGALIQSDITRRYAPYNITLVWRDNGVLVHEWDADGDGESYEPDYSERQAPMTQGWIPNQEQVFSNLYILRSYKDPTLACGSSGAGSSLGMGPTNPPPRAGYRAACPGNVTELGQSLTLAHELGHNLGLYHMSDTQANGSGNLMYVGRQEGIFFAPQWRIIHQTLDARLAAGDGGIRTLTTPRR